MARTALTAQQVAPTGLSPSYSAANADGHQFANDGNTLLHVKNGGAGACVVTVQTPQQIAGLDVAEQAITIPAGEERLIGRLRPATYNRPTGAADPNTVYVDFDAVDSVTVALIEP